MIDIFCADEMDLTMLRQICRRGRLISIMASASDRTTGRLLEDLVAHENDTRPTNGMKQLTLSLYDDIYSYVNKHCMLFRHYRNLPHPLGAAILPPMAAQTTYFKLNGRDFSVHGAHPGNSAIAFRVEDGGVETGFIEAAWTLTLPDGPRTFLVVQPHEQLSIQDNRKNPYRQRPGLLMRLVYKSSTMDEIIIEPAAIISHIAYRLRPAKTFRIQQPTMVVHVLDRGLSGQQYELE